MRELVYRIRSNALFICLLTLTLSHIALAQPDNRWVRYYDGINHRSDAFYDVFATTDSGYAMFGYSKVDVNQQAFWLVKSDREGNRQWQRIYTNGLEGYFQCWGTSIIQTDDGGYLAGGRKLGDGDDGSWHFTVIRMDEDGNQVWWRDYTENSRGACFAVIELKEGEFVVAGYSIDGGRHAFAAMLDRQGDVIWEEEHDGQWFMAVREVEDGLLFAGYNGRGWILKTNMGGEVVWSRDYECSNLHGLISCREGGFAVCGSQFNGETRGWYLLKTDGEGEPEWGRRYDMDGNNSHSYSIVQMLDGGFVLVGDPNGNMNRSGILRTDNAGNEMWHRFDQNREYGNVEEYLSTIIGHRGRVLIAGRASPARERRIDGVLLEVVPDISAPHIVEYSPEELVLTALINDTMIFSVEVVDLQGDSLGYLWTQNGDTLQPDTVANDTSAIAIIFEELGTDTVQCTVSDSTLSDSIRWIVYVEELYIDSYSPQILTLSTRRNSTIDFSVTTRAVEDDPVEYQLLLDDEQIAENDSVTIRFERGREHSVTAIASQGELADSVTWQVLVNDLIVDYMPEQLELSVEADTTFEFEVFPFDPEDDSLNFLWTLDGDSISDNSWVLVNFDSGGVYDITAYVSDTTESDSLTWEVNVTPNSVYDDEPRHPDTPTLYPPVPNPFNSVTTVRYYLPTTSQINLSLFDVNGRFVAELVDGRRTAGEHNLTLNAGELSSGLYFLRLQVEGQIETRKVLLIR